MKHKALYLSLAALMASSLSCDLSSTRPPTTGSISITLVSPSSGSVIAVVGSQSGANLAQSLSGVTHLTLDGARVTVTGPTNKTVSSSTASGGFFDITVDELEPGTYNVTVEGLVGGAVAYFGQSSGVGVTAGQTSQSDVSFPSFAPTSATAPDSIDVLRFTVSYAAVANAASYIVAWSTSPTMANASTKPVTGTSTEIQVTQEGMYWVTVRAVNATVPNGGAPSAPVPVFAFQGVATVTVTPATPSINVGATQQFTAEAKDADGVVVSNVTWFWASTNHGVATVNQSGLATGVGGGQAAITAVGKGTPGSAPLTVTALPATKLAFVVQPSNTVAGTSISPAIQVEIQNASSARVTSSNAAVTLAIGTNVGGAALSGTMTVNAIDGVASFSGLSLDKAGTGYTLTATSGTLTAATSTGFSITAAPVQTPTKLAFVVQPTNAVAATSISPAVQVEIQDASSARVTGSNAAVTIAIGTNPGTATLSGTATVNAINGVASFSGLSLSAAGTGYTLTAASGSLTGATSSAFNISAAPVQTPTKLAFSVAPANATAGDPLSPAVQVEIQDAAGTRVASARDAVTIAFGNNAGSGTLTGTKTVNAINGIASFTGISINKAAAGYTLGATSGSLTAATSGAFTISPAAPAKLAFDQQPTNVQGNVAMGASVTVKIFDAFDNFVANATNSVTLSIANNPYKGLAGIGGTVSATLLTVPAFAGTATFSGVKVDKPGTGYTLSATAPSLSAGTSAAFNVNIVITGSVSAATNGSHSCAISATSGTYCWGSNSSGQLGALTGVSAFDSVAANVRGGLTFVSVTTGGVHSCGLTAAGAAYCWGSGANGRLGNGAASQSDVPVLVSGNHVFAQIDAGASHTCGVTTANAGVPAEDQQVYCWGLASSGQLGDGAAAGTLIQSTVPLRVVEPLQTSFRAVSVSAGGSHTCAVSNSVSATTGAAYCWGANFSQQLGDGNPTFTSTSTPTLVAGGFTFTQVSAGSNHTCAIATTGAPTTGRCWGRGFEGQLGDGANVSSTPTSVLVSGSLTNWTRITAGAFHTCAVANTITYCWGQNTNGELGDDSPSGANANAPVVVAGGLLFLGVEAGGNHTCGRTAAGAFCWGTNSVGRLGSFGVGQVKRVPTAIIVQ